MSHLSNEESTSKRLFSGFSSFRSKTPIIFRDDDAPFQPMSPEEQSPKSKRPRFLNGFSSFRSKAPILTELPHLDRIEQESSKKDAEGLLSLDDLLHEVVSGNMGKSSVTIIES